MEKGKLIESIRQEILRQQPNQDSNKFAHFLTIEVEIGKAYNSALKEFYYNDKNLDNAELDFYAKKYELTVQRLNGESFVTLPVNPIELKKDIGIRSVKPKSTISNQVGDYSFIRTSDVELELIRPLEIFCCSKKAFYYKDGNRLVLIYPQIEFNIIDKVIVKLLPSFADMAMTDNIEFPMGEMNATATLLQIMGVRPVNNLNADDAR